MLLMFRDWNFFDFSPLLVFADTKDILDHLASERHKTSSLKQDKNYSNDDPPMELGKLSRGPKSNGPKPLGRHPPPAEAAGFIK